MRCVVRSPERTLLDAEAEMVIARSDRGEFALMSGHAPLLAQLEPGPLRVKAADSEHVFACFGGTLDVQLDVVTVLVSEAIPLEQIDAQLSIESGEEGDKSQARVDLLRHVKETYG